ncbi:MAG TPA: DEAD/DEAH box helicase, partial [Candidatus Baltobacteraceae bacterium]|nr:DEAD/DEAH box helicase [Candidatus Baltobacteraceae bacterium]
PHLAAWCRTHLHEPTVPQRGAIPAGLDKRNLLICSPTGTGKTLAAFLPVISGLAHRRDRDELYPRTFALYVSPLRALGYDVEHNVRRPMREIGLLERPNTERPRLRRGRIRERYARTGVRTSDTPQEERRLMLSRAPHILVTTPESLAVMLAMESYRKTLTAVETVIVDEVHALAGNKRGSQLALLLESLEELVRAPFNRVGLSATINPLDRVAKFLAGTQRDCEIIDARGLRSIDIDVVAPFSGAVAPLAKVAQTAADLTERERTTLVFTNVRSQAERVAHEMTQHLEAGAVETVDAQARERIYDERIGVHHSALERSVRHRVEAALRAGKLRTVVCSSSLELGVDIGCIDRVLVIGGARGMTPSLQRIGRAGHRPGAVARGTVIAQDRDDVIEAAATKRCIADGVLEDTAIPQAPLDVLAQWLVGSVCYDRRLPVDKALAIARRAYPYADLQRENVVRCARYLSGGGVGSEEAHVRRIGFDGEAIYGLGREVCAAFFENVGTIPDEQHVMVRIKGGNAVGRVEESFVNDAQVGDVFVLNGKTLRIKEIIAAGITVEPFAGRPTVPQWSSHLKGIPQALAREIHVLRKGVEERLRDGEPQTALDWVESRYGLERLEAAHAVRHVAQQMAISAVPSESKPVIEIYRMDRRQTAVFHTGAGRRINETLARALAARVYARIRANTTLTTDDGGFLLTLPPGKKLPDAVWASLLRPQDFERDLLAGLRSSHLIHNFFRQVASTGLLVLRRAGGRTLRRGSLSWSSQKIFERVYAADRKFPLLRETFRAVTRDLLDAPGARAYLEQIDGEPRVLHPPAASPFTFGILTSSFGDSVVLDDRASMVQALHERVLEVLKLHE